MRFTDIKAPEPTRGVPPWRDSRWVADAQDWIDAQCARAGLARSGPVLARGRSYSVVARVPAGGGTIWFKASPPASSFEPALLAALAAWQPGRFTAPLAVDVGRAWSLTRDGGPTLREDLVRRPGTAAWHGPLRDYARLQLSLAPRAGDLLALGLADLRPASVPGQVARLLSDPRIEQAAAAPDGITQRQLQALRGLLPRVREWCAELDGLGIPPSLDHADVHAGNILAATGTPFDWGDAALAHPFGSLLVTLRTAAVSRALRIAPLARALTWRRVFPCFLAHPEPARNAARALAAVLRSDPLAVTDERGSSWARPPALMPPSRSRPVEAGKLKPAK